MQTARLMPFPPLDTPSTAVCVLLVDLVGSTSLAQRLPLGVYTELMTDFVQVLVLNCEALEGQVLQHQGDAVLAYWPAAKTFQAVQAGLACHGRAARLALAGALGTDLRVRVGLARGEVITRVVGGQPSAYGLPVNYARRLCDAAAPGETLACANVMAELGEHAASLVAVQRGRLNLRGFGADCQAYLLSSTVAAQTA